MHQNNLIYKGYRLTARVSRGAGAEVQALSSGPIFIASITVVQAGAVQDGGDEYPVPRFADGGYVTVRARRCTPRYCMAAKSSMA